MPACSVRARTLPLLFVAYNLRATNHGEGVYSTLPKVVYTKNLDFLSKIERFVLKKQIKCWVFFRAPAVRKIRSPFEHQAHDDDSSIEISVIVFAEKSFSESFYPLKQQKNRACSAFFHLK